MTSKLSSGFNRLQLGQIAPEQARRIKESIAEESDALIIPRNIRLRSERFIDRDMIIFAISPVVGLIAPTVLFPRVSWLLIAYLLLGIYTLATGGLMLAEVPIVYDHKVCRRCGYPYDEESQPDHCPECGANLRRDHSVGYWRSWRPKLRKRLFWVMLSCFVISLVVAAIWL